MVVFGNGTIRNNTDWEKFKSLVDTKRLKVQYDVISDGYEVFALDNNILYSVKIKIGDVPYTSDIDQSTNDSYTQDFVDNFLPTANKISILRNELIDGYGTPLAVKDGDTMPGGQPGIMVHAKDGYEPTKVRALETVSDGDINRLAVNARLVPGTSVIVGAPIPEILSNLIVGKLRNSNQSSNMIVDGSTTPIEFSFKAPNDGDGYDVAVSEVRLVVSTQDFTFDGASFGSKPALTKGVKIDVRSENELALFLNIKVNEDFLFFPTTSGLTLNNTGPKDVLVASVQLGGVTVLRRGTDDKVTITIRDNLTGGGATAFNYMQAQLYGARVNT